MLKNEIFFTFDAYFSFLVLNVIVDRGYYLISLQHHSLNGAKGA